MSDTLKTVLVDNGVPVASSTGNTQFVYNLLPIGRFYDKRYGEITVSDKMLKRMETNFGKYPSYEVPVKIGHDDGALSPGKVISVEAKPEGLIINMVVDQDTSEAILKEQYRYMSAEFDENYQDKETGRFVGAVLLGAALVNQPANPYMEPLKLVDDINPKGGNNNMELEELQKKLSEAEVQTQLLREKLDEKTKRLAEVSSRAELAEENMKATQKEAEDNAKKLAEAEEKIRTAAEEAEATAKKLSDLEAENKVLIETREQAENAKNEAEVKAFADKWTSQGIPPVVMEKVKPLLLNKETKIIKLSDKDGDTVPSLKFFDDLFTDLPKMPMQQIGNGETQTVELSDIDKARERAKIIAESLK